MISIVLVVCSLICALLAVHARRLLTAALWLAAVSALVSVLLYQLGAAEVAVIELSVGAGLVTILFVFAISVVGSGKINQAAIVPPLLAVVLMLSAAGMLAWLTYPWTALAPAAPAAEPAFRTMLWDVRGLDVILQIGLIFGAVMCILGLIGERIPETVAVQQPARSGQSPDGALEPTLEEAIA